MPSAETYQNGRDHNGLNGLHAGQARQDQRANPRFGKAPTSAGGGGPFGEDDEDEKGVVLTDRQLAAILAEHSGRRPLVDFGDLHTRLSEARRRPDGTYRTGAEICALGFAWAGGLYCLAQASAFCFLLVDGIVARLMT